MLPTLSLQARIGETNIIPVSIQTSVLKYTAIQNIEQSAPARITATGHGALDKWQVAVIDALGMEEINAADSNNLQDSDFHRARVITSDVVELENVSSMGFSQYTGKGCLAYFLPLDLSSYTAARMDLKDAVGGTTILTGNLTNGILALDVPASIIWITLTPTDLASIAAGTYYFDIELVKASGIDAVCSSSSVFEILDEITTSS